MSEASRPNVLLISTDQQRWDHLGAEGTPGIFTPHLDRLAARGMRFRRAYCTSPICTPSRVSLLTGRYPSSHGAYSIGVTVEDFPRTLPELMQEAGYATALVGKTHFVARPDERAHIRGKADATDGDFAGWSGPYLGFEHVRVSSGHTINCVPNMHYLEFLEAAGADYAQWFPQMRPGYSNQVAGAWNIPPQYHDTEWVTGECLDWLRQRDGRPWFLWASYQDPHEPFVCPEPWFSAVDAQVLEPLPGASDLRDRPSFYSHVLEHGEAGWGYIDDGYGVPCVFRWPRMDEMARTALQATAGMVRFLDDRIGRLLDHLEATGELSRTLIIFTSDHGEMHGHHGFWGKGLTAFEDCQRVPLIMAGPGVEGGIASEALVSLVDLPRTILSAAGIKAADGFEGSDLSPVLAGQRAGVNSHVFVECEATHRIAQLTCIRENEKLVVCRGSEEGELYDLARDPDQHHNLWSDPAQEALRSEILDTLVRPRLERFPLRTPRKAFA